jgi:hypothetical protein
MKSTPNKARLGLSLCLLPVVLLLARPAAASTVVSMDFADISQHARQVIGGRITSMVSEQDAASGYIYSTVTVAVSAAVPAEFAGREYKFRMIGGQVGDKTLAISDFPQLQTDQSVVLFLADQTETVFGPTVGLWQGVFFVERDASTGKETITDHQRRRVLGVRNRQLIRGFGGASAESAPQGVGVKEFLDQVRAYRGAAGR